MKSSLRIALVGGVFACGSFQFAHAEDEAADTSESRTVSTAVKAWKEYVELLATSNLSAELAAKSRSGESSKQEESWRIGLVLADPYFSCEVDTYNSSGALIARDLLRTNKSYSFEISGLEEWKLDNITMSPHSTGSAATGVLGDRRERGQTLRYACRGMVVNITWMAGVLADPSFTVLEESTVRGKDNREYIKLQYEYYGHRGNDVVGNGILVLDPNRYWMIVEATIDAHFVDGIGYLQIKNSFSETADGLPVIATHSFRKGLKNENDQLGKPDFVTEYTYNWKPLSSGVIEAEYMLGAYGFAEPKQPSKWRFLALNIAAVLFLGLALVFKRTMRRFA